MNKKERYERYKYLTGLSAWEIASYKDKDNVVILNDGPSGLRKPICNEHTKQNEIIQTVCFPTPSALAASFDKEIVYNSSKNIALECKRYGTDILLAPGVNIKKYVLCGRNFEYFSEDPFLAGLLAASYVNGLEENGVGACLKHFAVNSQEWARTISSADVSLRALNEIYLRVFKYALKYSNPTAIMTSYNRINGVYVNESDYLINKKLRGEYNFKGLIMSDWCAISDKGKTISTGVNIEMPKSLLTNEEIDVQYGTCFNDEDLIKRDEETYNSLLRFKNKERLKELDLDVLHSNAVEIANKTLVLAKNDNHYFPLNKDEKVLVLGYFANHSRFVGNGSGFVKAYRKETFIDVLDKQNISYEFIECFDGDDVSINADKLIEYKNRFDKVILFLGQYQEDESEGEDRKTIQLRKSQIDTLKMVKEVFDDFGVVLISGSVVDVSEIYKLSNSLLITYLAGEGQAEAIFNNLYGINNPSGRLPETWISDIYQNEHNHQYDSKDYFYTLYTDDVFVGYRYYDLGVEGFYLPFGYGLSYSTFSYSNFSLEKEENLLKVHLNIKNESEIDGEDVIQIYVAKEASSIYRPKKELKGFKKIFVPKKTEKEVVVSLDIDDLTSYRDKTDSFELEDGIYQIYIMKNAKEIIQKLEIKLDGIIFEEIKSPKTIIPSVGSETITLDHPLVLLYKNPIFEKYIYEHHKEIDLKPFYDLFPHAGQLAIRKIVSDEFLKISFTELKEIVDLINNN